MKKKISSLLVYLLFVGVCFFSFYSLTPRNDSQLEHFDLEKAKQHVKIIAKEPHSIGTSYHGQVKKYIVEQLQSLGLSVHTQKDYVLNEVGQFTAPENIITRIEGSEPDRKALLVMTHYDSAVHSSFGASDAASGVATILEVLRNFLAQENKPKNDIIILFTDAEEVGLNGAALFVDDHPWADEIGLVLNFEARGSGGPSNTIIESNSGNKTLISEFSKARTKYPLANSLMYSVYKKLPNDTDATVFREQKEIPSFFFAFIDDHFDYHTANDTAKNLDDTSLLHQASYLEQLLPHFAEIDLATLPSEEDMVYFDLPVIEMVYFPFAYIFPLLILGWIVLIALCLYGFRQKLISFAEVTKSFKSLLLFLMFGLGFSWLIWFVSKLIYPSVQENLNGFTYNGHWYILAISALSFALAHFLFYPKKSSNFNQRTSTLLPGIVLILLICTLIAFILPGAFYFIFAFYFALAAFGLRLFQIKNLFILALLGLPSLLIFAPLVQFFPVGLGLKILPASTLLIYFIFVGWQASWLELEYKKPVGFAFIFIGLLAIIVIHLKSDFNELRPKPNSLLYVFNVNENQANWYSYDEHLDSFTQQIFDAQDRIQKASLFDSKYQMPFTFEKQAPILPFKPAQISIKSKYSNSISTRYKLTITPQRDLNRIEITKPKDLEVLSLKINEKTIKNSALAYYKNKRESLLTYYVVDNDTLRIEIELPKDNAAQLTLFEASNNLLSQQKFTIEPRSTDQMPKPFILNDAIITQQIIELK
ncbi:M20/M25/M40 family metallo-hydrolase [Mesonia sp. HuA40]|uniref:M20/M25/M40 family metallo-hydrolase n=1 Tax=Mesonia sp. HuA40 TaxID=2602761 RepID=UPI0011CBA600|nr:M20/M25/M40 family metallo-hydrolase [Mesonia sp. HuA40]TXK72441.1 M20/M25/M40 family metallo-hydrolase [Mesonia sp. HuA40]